MKKILKYSAILSVAYALSVPTAQADTGGYALARTTDSHFHSMMFGNGTIYSCGSQTGGGQENCLFASNRRDLGDGANEARLNRLDWRKDDGEGFTIGADYGFFRVEVDGTYTKGTALAWRGHAATGGSVWTARLFSNVLVEPLDFFELIGEFGGIDPLVKYNPAHYGISPYALIGYGVMGGFVDDLSYKRMVNKGTSNNLRGTLQEDNGMYAGGAIPAVQYGAGLNIGLDQLVKGFSEVTGASLPEYFKLPVEFRVGYQWQVGIDSPLFENYGEKLGIDDGGWTYAVGLKW